jgi:hypothetical protein
MNQINHHLQQRRTQEAWSFGIISAFTQLIKPLSNHPRLSEAQQIDFIEKIDTADLPSNDITVLEGDPFVLIRNIDTPSGLGKGRRCCAIQIKIEQWFFSSRRVKPGHSREFPWNYFERDEIYMMSIAFAINCRRNCAQVPRDDAPASRN